MGNLRAPTAAIANLGVTSRSETLWGLLNMLRSLSGRAWEAGLGWVWLQQREEGRKKSRWKYFVQTFRAETKTWTLRPKNLLPDKFCFLHIERQNLIKINPNYSAWVIRKYLFFCIFWHFYLFVTFLCRFVSDNRMKNSFDSRSVRTVSVSASVTSAASTSSTASAPATTATTKAESVSSS